MADDGILGLLGRMNDPAALYGGALSDERTRQAMAGRGLLAMAGSFADSAMPTRMPTPFGAVLGHAASAAGASQDVLMESRLRNAQAQQAMATSGLLNQMGPAYEMMFKEIKRQQDAAAAAASGGIPNAPPPGTVPGTVGAGGPAPTGPIDPALVTWEAKNQGINPLIAHTTADIESSYGANTGNKISPSNTGVFQRAPADAPGGQNDTHANQIRLGVQDLVGERDGLRRTLGREPTNAEVYLAHQQGVLGATKLINNPSTPAGELVPAINISNNAGNPKAPASAFVQHWADTYAKREGKFASLAAPPEAGPTGGGVHQVTAEAPLPPPGGLLNLPPGIAERMNEPIPGIAGVTPGASGPAPSAARPQSAGDILVAANQRMSAAGGPPPLPPGLVQTADASGQVPIPPGLMVGGKALPGLLGGGAAPPGPAPGAPTPLVTASPQTAEAPVPPTARPQPVPAPAPAALPAAGPPVAPQPLNLPMPPPMPGGMGPPVQATPLQMIAQGIAGLSSLTGHPAPDFVQKLAGQPVEMQMEAYKAYVGAQANQLTEKYKKEIEVASAGTISYLTRMGQLPGDIALRTAEQELNLRKEMLTQHGLARTPDGKGWQIDPVWLNAQAQKAAVAEDAKAQRELVDVTVPVDPNNPNGPQRKQQMTRAQATEYASGRGPGTPGVVPGTSGQIPGIPGQPIYNPMEKSGMEAVAAQNAKAFEKVHADAEAANETQTQATNMREASKSFYTGPGAEYNQALNKVLVTLSGDPERANKVASYETFIKDTGFLARDQARQMGAVRGVQELQMVRDSLAGPTTTARGIDRVMAQIQGLSDYKLVKQQAMNNYVTRPGAAPGGWDNSGFEAQFNANVSPYTYMFLRLSEQDKAEMIQKLSSTKEGQTDLQRLNGQIKHIAANPFLAPR